MTRRRALNWILFIHWSLLMRYIRIALQITVYSYFSLIYQKHPRSDYRRIKSRWNSMTSLTLHSRPLHRTCLRAKRVHPLFIPRCLYPPLTPFALFTVPSLLILTRFRVGEGCVAAGWPRMKRRREVSRAPPDRYRLPDTRHTHALV
jgi:hypothetical protein